MEGGCVRVGVGLLLLSLAAVFLFFTWHGVVKRPILGMALGIVFAFVGTVIAFTASGFHLDRRRRIVTGWSSFLGLVKTQQYDFDQLRAVRLTEYWNRSRHGPARLFRILLSFKAADVQSLELAGGLGEHRALAFARRLADFTDLPIEIELLTGEGQR